MQVLENVDILKSTTIKIYVSNLGAYNAGVLTGEWVTLPVDDIKEIFKRDREKFGGADNYGDEYFISDYEAPFKIYESDDIGDLNKLAAALQENGLETIEDVYNDLENPQDITEPPYDWDDFIDLIHDMDTVEVMRATKFGHINFNDDYLRFDGYGNFESLTEWNWIQELNGYSDDIMTMWAAENGINL